MAKQKIRIRLKAYEHRILDQSAENWSWRIRSNSITN